MKKKYTLIVVLYTTACLTITSIASENALPQERRNTLANATEKNNDYLKNQINSLEKQVNAFAQEKTKQDQSVDQTSQKLLRKASKAVLVATRIRRLTRHGMSLERNISASQTNTPSISFTGDNLEDSNISRNESSPKVKKATLLYNPQDLTSPNATTGNQSNFDNSEYSTSFSTASPNKRRKSVSERLQEAQLENSMRPINSNRRISLPFSTHMSDNNNTSNATQPETPLPTTPKRLGSSTSNSSSSARFLSFQRRAHTSSSQVLKENETDELMQTLRKASKRLKQDAPTSNFALSTESEALSTSQQSAASPNPLNTTSVLSDTVDNTTKPIATIANQSKNIVLQHKEEISFSAVVAALFTVKKTYDWWHGDSTVQKRSLTDVAALGGGMTFGIVKGVGLAVTAGIGYRMLRNWFCAGYEKRLEVLEQKQSEIINAFDDHATDISALKKHALNSQEFFQNLNEQLNQNDDHIIEIASALQDTGEACNHNADILEELKEEFETVVASFDELINRPEFIDLFTPKSNKKI